jgi:hypothetical protein
MICISLSFILAVYPLTLAMRRWFAISKRGTG